MTEETVFEEGRAVMHYVPGQEVFYNPVQEFNRDLSILVIRNFLKINKNSLIVSRKKQLKQAKYLEGRELSKASQNLVQIKLNELIKEHTDKIIKPGGSTDTNLHKILDRPADQFIILEALSATGLRSIRYALEITEAYKIVANDLQHQAVCSIVYNSKLNGVLDKMVPCEMDAVNLLQQVKSPSHDRVQVIDLDPYGSPSLFLDSALQAINDGGLLCITCTDVAGLCGNCPEAAYGKYAAFPTKCKCCHEMAIRLALSCVDATANRFKRYVVPLLSLSVDFYLRIFVQVFTSANEVRKSCMKKSYFLNCDNCHSFALQKVGKKLPNKDKYLANYAMPVEKSICTQCDSQMKLAGPIWSDPIHDYQFVSHLLEEVSRKDSNSLDAGQAEDTDHLNGKVETNNNFKTKKRIIGMLTMVLEELPDSPLFYSISDLFSVIKCTTAPINNVMSAIKSLGYQVSLTHAKSNSIKTDAPSKVVWDVIKYWALHHSTDYSVECCQQNPHAKTIMSKEVTIKPDFTVDKNVIANSKRKKLCRFQTNPAPYWGPMSRDTIGVIGASPKNKVKRPKNTE